jgi:hypothetical protein
MAMNLDDFDVTKPIGMIDYLRGRIKELKEEAERRERAAFYSGYKGAVGDAFQDWDNDIMEALYEASRLTDFE